MKLLTDVIISEVNGEYVAVATGKTGKKFNGMVRMNGTAAFIAKKLKSETSEDGIVAALLEEYDVTEEIARKNVKEVIDKFKEIGILENV